MTDQTTDQTADQTADQPGGRPGDNGLAGADAAQKQRPFSRHTSELVEHAQDILSGAVAVTMVLLAAGILIGGIVDFATTTGTEGLTNAATFLVDKVLLVLILVEIVHTVVLSLRAHALAAQPFVVVGLVAVIRKILFVLAGQQKIDVATLGLYIGMVAVFVASLVAIEVLANRRGPRSEGGDGLSGLR